MSTQYFCKNQERRDLLIGHPTLNGIDFLEVRDYTDSSSIKKPQCELVIHLINPLAVTLKKENIAIDGGIRIRHIKVIDDPFLDLTPAKDKKELTVHVDRAGDFSTYTLRIVDNVDSLKPPVGFDPILWEIDFSFKVECPSEFDCKKEEICPPLSYPEPEINYLKLYWHMRLFIF